MGVEDDGAGEKSVSFDRAIALLRENISSIQATPVPLGRVDGCILAEDLLAIANSPPFHRAAMDGYAVRYHELEAGVRDFPVSAVKLAGQSGEQSAPAGTVLKIMTGAAVPEELDAVVPVEDVEALSESSIRIQSDRFSQYMNIARKGESARVGENLVSAGMPVNANLAGLLSSMGYESIAVRMLPTISIVVTGNEVGAGAAQNGIGDFNGVAIRSHLQSVMHRPVPVHIEHTGDDRARLTEVLESALQISGWVIITGGISKGDTDYVPGVLEELGVRVLFRGVKMKPGKPVMAGLSKTGKPVLALPGNPVSSVVGFRLFGAQILRAMLRLRLEQDLFCRATKDLIGKEGTDLFTPVRVESTPEGLFCTPISYRGSGDLISISRSDGFVHVPADSGRVATGQMGQVYLWETML